MTKEEILAIRKTMGFNQTRFADLLDITVTTVCRWEKGKSSPRIRHVAAMKRIQLNHQYIVSFKKNKHLLKV